MLLLHRLTLFNAQTSSSYTTSVTQGNLAYISQGEAFEKVYEGEQVRVYENSLALPRAFLVRDVKLVSSAEAADEIVHQGAFQDGAKFVPRDTAIVEAPLSASPPADGAITLRAFPIEPDYWTVVEWGDSQGGWHQVEGWQAPFDDQHQVAWGISSDDFGKGPFRWVIHERKGGAIVAASDPFDLPASAGEAVGIHIPLLWSTPVQPSSADGEGGRLQAEVTATQAGRMEVQTLSDSNAFLVYSENHFPGWKATLDGQHVDLYRTSGTLLGVPVPAGQHTVVLTYLPPTLYLAVLSTLITISITVGLVSGAVRQIRRNRQRP